MTAAHSPIGKRFWLGTTTTNNFILDHPSHKFNWIDPFGPAKSLTFRVRIGDSHERLLGQNCPKSIPTRPDWTLVQPAILYPAIPEKVYRTISEHINHPFPHLLRSKPATPEPLTHHRCYLLPFPKEVYSLTYRPTLVRCQGTCLSIHLTGEGMTL